VVSGAGLSPEPKLSQLGFSPVDLDVGGPTGWGLLAIPIRK
jgi:hypothetical protein